MSTETREPSAELVTLNTIRQWADGRCGYPPKTGGAMPPDTSARPAMSWRSWT